MDDLILLDWGAFTLFLLIFMRMSGFIVLNPLFGREGVPKTLQAGLVFIFAVLIYGLEGGRVDIPNTNIQLMVLMLSEFMVGAFVSFVMQLFFSIPATGGSIMDAQIGFAMAQAYDPTSGATITVSSHLFNAMMILSFFIADGHLTLIRLFMTSGDMVPYGNVLIGEKNVLLLVEIFIECMLISVKLTMPVLAAELLGQVGMGVLMKAIPQINVFVINIDLKVLIGLTLLFFFTPAIMEFLFDAEILMMNYVRETLLSISGA